MEDKLGDLIEKIVKISGKVFWFLIIIMGLLWYSLNRKEFFSQKKPISEFHRDNFYVLKQG